MCANVWILYPKKECHNFERLVQKLIFGEQETLSYVIKKLKLAQNEQMFFRCSWKRAKNELWIGFVFVDVYWFCVFL